MLFLVALGSGNSASVICTIRLFVLWSSSFGNRGGSRRALSTPLVLGGTPVKHGCTGKFVPSAAKKASLSRQRISSLEHTLFFLRYRADRGEDVSTLINDTRAELEDLHRQRSRGTRIRSNVQ